MQTPWNWLFLSETSTDLKCLSVLTVLKLHSSPISNEFPSFCVEGPNVHRKQSN